MRWKRTHGWIQPIRRKSLRGTCDNPWQKGTSFPRRGPRVDRRLRANPLSFWFWNAGWMMRRLISNRQSSNRQRDWIQSVDPSRYFAEGPHPNRAAYLWTSLDRHLWTLTVPSTSWAQRSLMVVPLYWLAESCPRRHPASVSVAEKPLDPANSCSVRATYLLLSSPAHPVQTVVRSLPAMVQVRPVRNREPGWGLCYGVVATVESLPVPT